MAAVTAVTLGAAVQGAAGFGHGLLATPVLALIDSRLVPAPMLVLSFVVAASTGWRARAHLDARRVGWALSGRLPGVVAGAAALNALSPSGLGLFISVMVLAAVAASASGLQVRPTRLTSIVAGAVSGFTGTTTSIGGPPIALVFQERSGSELRSLLGTFLALGLTMSIVALSITGQMGFADLGRAAVLLPGVAIGLGASRRLIPLADSGHTRTIVLGLSTLSALALLVRVLV